MSQSVVLSNHCAYLSEVRNQYLIILHLLKKIGYFFFLCHSSMEDDPINQASMTDSRQTLDQPFDIRARRFLKGTH